MVLSIHNLTRFCEHKEKREMFDTGIHIKSTFRAYSKEPTPTLKKLLFLPPCFLLAILYPILLHSTLKEV